MHVKQNFWAVIIHLNTEYAIASGQYIDNLYYIKPITYYNGGVGFSRVGTLEGTRYLDINDERKLGDIEIWSNDGNPSDIRLRGIPTNIPPELSEFWSLFQQKQWDWGSFTAGGQFDNWVMSLDEVAERDELLDIMNDWPAGTGAGSGQEIFNALRGDMFVNNLPGEVSNGSFRAVLETDVRRVGAWKAISAHSPTLRVDIDWLDYIIDGVLTQKLKYSQAAISAKVVNAIPNTTLYQITDDLDAIYDAALIAKDELIEITNTIANNSNGIPGFRPDYDSQGNFLNGLKSRARAEEKIASDYGGDASRLVDVAGSKVVYEKLDDLYAALDYAFTNFEIIKIKDRIKNPLTSGYRDILINLRMSNDHIVEFKFALKEIDEADAAGHILYEEVRSIQALINTTQNGVPTASQIQQMDELTNQASQLYGNAYQTILNRQ